jgi:hypothetical protein
VLATEGGGGNAAGRSIAGVGAWAGCSAAGADGASTTASCVTVGSGVGSEVGRGKVGTAPWVGAICVAGACATTVGGVPTVGRGVA